MINYDIVYSLIRAAGLGHAVQPEELGGLQGDN